MVIFSFSSILHIYYKMCKIVRYYLIQQDTTNTSKVLILKGFDTIRYWLILHAILFECVWYCIANYWFYSLIHAPFFRYLTHILHFVRLLYPLVSLSSFLIPFTLSSFLIPFTLSVCYSFLLAYKSITNTLYP